MTRVSILAGWILPILLGTHQCTSFVTNTLHRVPFRQRPALFLSSASSRLAGNQREPTPQEIAVMDEMIMKLAEAKPYELPTSVQRAFRVISSPRFFVRIAELTDQSTDEVEKEKLIVLASNLASTLEAVVSSAKEKMEEYAKDVETVVKAAAEPDSGEFLVPLLPERINAMRAAMYSLDTVSLEGDTFLSTVDAWMNKSHEDGMDLMVGILQKVLQMYAGRRIGLARSAAISSTDEKSSRGAVDLLLDELLQTDADSWDICIRRGVNNGAISSTELIAEIQRNMEMTVLSLESGSMVQRVLAEYLQEMVKRIEAVQKTM